MDKQFKDYNLPDERGHFEKFGGKFVPETLIPALEELERHYAVAKQDEPFQDELNGLLKHYSGRETALYFADRISEKLGFNVWLKREDLNHTGAHKINNALGQILLARRMGKKRIIA
ncbi:MAG TPA: pyridoxal-phosphate dependent enzyme, partial [Candidatus Marinimicrobia bacterium]|nr:pyridoxal-phosphate dependent enzyme [Candidatus Neomarinimicrobiota bacterium]